MVIKTIGYLIGVIVLSFFTYTLVNFFTMPAKSRTMSMHTGPTPRFLIAIFIIGFACADVMLIVKLFKLLGVL